jgi:ribosome maturation factor RimP
VTDELPFENDTAAAISGALAAHGLELWHIGWKRGRSRGVLTLTIDKPAGVTLDDCERASHLAGEIPDARDPSDVPYSLEVESPGLDRPLHSPAHCERFAGRRVTVQLKTKVDGAGRLKGVLESVAGEALTSLDEDQRRRYTVQFGDVKLARLVPEL